MEIINYLNYWTYEQWLDIMDIFDDMKMSIKAKVYFVFYWMNTISKEKSLMEIINHPDDWTESQWREMELIVQGGTSSEKARRVIHTILQWLTMKSKRQLMEEEFERYIDNVYAKYINRSCEKLPEKHEINQMKDVWMCSMQVYEKLSEEYGWK